MIFKLYIIITMDNLSESIKPYLTLIGSLAEERRRYIFKTYKNSYIEKHFCGYLKKLNGLLELLEKYEEENL